MNQTATRCPLCSSLVSLHTSPEGTSSYVPLEREPAGYALVQVVKNEAGETHYVLNGGKLMSEEKAVRRASEFMDLTGRVRHYAGRVVEVVGGEGGEG